MRKIIEHGADINFKDLYRQGPLTLASWPWYRYSSHSAQEGMWGGSLIARFIAEVAEIEEVAGLEDGGDINCTFYILERARFSDVVIAMSETPGYRRLVGDFAKDIPI